MSENEKEKRPKKAPAPVKFYALIGKEVVDEASGEKWFPTMEIEADKKSELFAELEKLDKPNVLMLIRGRKINLQQKVSYKI